MAPIGGVRSGIISAARDAIPDNAVAQFYADKSFSTDQEGETVSEWSDVSGQWTASSGSAEVVTDSDENLALNFSDPMVVSDFNQTQKTTVIAVVDPAFGSNNSNYEIPYNTNDSGNIEIYWHGDRQNWVIWAGGDVLDGSTDTSIRLLSGVFDSTSELREDGSQTVSGDAGSGSFDGLVIGGGSYDDNPFDGPISFLEIYDGKPSGGVAQREQEVIEMLGLSI